MTIDDALIPVVLPSERALIACGVAWRGVYLITCNFEWGVRDHKFTLFRAPNEAQAADRRVPGASVAVEIQGPDSDAKISFFKIFFEIFFKNFFETFFAILWKRDRSSTRAHSSKKMSIHMTKFASLKTSLQTFSPIRKSSLNKEDFKEDSKEGDFGIWIGPQEFCLLLHYRAFTE